MSSFTHYFWYFTVAISTYESRKIYVIFAPFAEIYMADSHVFDVLTALETFNWRPSLFESNIIADRLSFLYHEAARADLNWYWLFSQMLIYDWWFPGFPPAKIVIDSDVIISYRRLLFFFFLSLDSRWFLRFNLWIKICWGRCFKRAFLCCTFSLLNLFIIFPIRIIVIFLRNRFLIYFFLLILGVCTNIINKARVVEVKIFVVAH